MSQATSSKQAKDLDEYDCGGNGPRWPVPGEESRMQMTMEDTNHRANIMAEAKRLAELLQRINSWQNDLSNLLYDQDGINLFREFVKQDAGTDSIHYCQLEFYLACRGLQLAEDESQIRRYINAIYNKYLKSNPVAPLPDDLKNTIRKIKKNELPPNRLIFEGLQRPTFDIINTTIYPNFLTSSVFIQYVTQIEQSAASAAAEASASAKAAATVVGAASVSTNTAAATTPPTLTMPSFTPTASNTRTNFMQNICDSSSDGNTMPPHLSNNNNNNTSSINNNKNISKTNIASMPIPTNLSIPNELQTLHEDAELVVNDRATVAKTSTDRHVPKLTAEMLFATQKGRLEVRPSGAAGYTYNVKYNASFNPVTRADSGRNSCSSASLTDSEVNSKDGKPYGLHRHRNKPEHMRYDCMNPSIPQQNTVIKPLAQASKNTFGSIQKSRLENAAKPFDPDLLTRKLLEFQKSQDQHEKQEQFGRSLNDRLTQIDDLDGQSILDQHVSRVFSPHQTPGTVSPGQFHRPAMNEMSPLDFALRHSKSTPDHASMSVSIGGVKKPPSRWSSTYVDSGISMYSTIEPFKPPNSDTLRSSKYRKPLPIPPSLQASTMTMSSGYHTSTLPRSHDSGEETIAVYTFSDEKVPYRIRLEGRHITLKQYKEKLPKKGNFRYFFQTTCDDPDNPIIQEEVVNDMDVIPLYEGKIMGMLK